MPEDPYNLDRFIDAQASVFETVLQELRAGRKQSHWMWYIFPQLRGLGASSMSDFYGIGSLDEARAYLGHPVLGERLVRCTAQVLQIGDRSLRAIFGTPDDMKFRSSMTLFDRAAGKDQDIFQRALDRYCDGKADERTLAHLSAGA
ncbi:DUF1810 domain-containing protein [Microvirga puerhi]|uniref:DUF1810 domain-containing protein n=1 Tax=Microvirga puerhi TaxID=2876078 RepID=A0ABS7VNS4_9HYPH|nr:DUF1810 domain-containing protein [Microvirga puerhi]MBZ6076687.1 DUF1810 domain-containing protein [Microvirga puerhi]